MADNPTYKPGQLLETWNDYSRTSGEWCREMEGHMAAADALILTLTAERDEARAELARFRQIMMSNDAAKQIVMLTTERDEALAKVERLFHEGVDKAIMIAQQRIAARKEPTDGSAS